MEGDDLERELRSRPGVNVPKLPPSTEILFEAGCEAYSLVVGDNGIVFLETTHPVLKRLGRPARCRFIGSGVGKLLLEDWLGAGLCPVFQFFDECVMLSYLRSAMVVGDGYRYDVF